MWIRNLDTGKWGLQVDQLPKDYYDGLKQDIEAVKLYSKCLSGAVYISIDNFDNIYNTLQIDKLGYYIDDNYANINLPTIDPKLSLNSSNYEEFYQKYLKENAFTIKNLFTPTKLINTEISNFSIVDVCTTEYIKGLTLSKPVLSIDGVRLIDGHRVLVKDQMTEVTIPITQNANTYFTQVELVSEYFFVETNVTDVTYKFYNEENGVYLYTNGRLIKQDDLSTYEKSYKLKVNVKYGNTNNDKEFHLKRLNNNYYPVNGQNVSFVENQNWILRHRLDYNNVLDLNHYDLIKSNPTSVYSKIEDFTYSIPERLIAVGEFGVIINNQDKLDVNATYSNSTIIDTKYKLNLRSVSETNDYYWICGDEGTLLKVYKPDFSIERIELNIFSQLTSVSFFDNLNGFVVGKFNQIFHTTDGGIKWNRLNYPEYESFSYTKVVYRDFNKVYISGSTGLFLELTRDVETWISYKRQIFKLSQGDNYVLVDDIYDLLPLKWTTVKDFTYVNDQESSDFAKSLNFNFAIDPLRYDTLIIDVETKYTGNPIFDYSEFYVDVSLSGKFSGVVYEDNINTPGVFIPNEYTFYRGITPSNIKFSQAVKLPLDTNGNLLADSFSLSASVFYNYDGDSDTKVQNFFYRDLKIDFQIQESEIVLISTDDTIIVYDVENKLYEYNNDFIYIEFNKKIGDIRTITKPKISSDDRVYIGADKVYYFKLGDLKNYKTIGENLSTSKLINGPDLYVNKLISDDKLYLAGNEALLRQIDIPNIGINNQTQLWDPTFINKYKSKFLFLDYDIASKVNFFTDLGQYRMPETVSIPHFDLTGSNAFFEMISITDQTSWIDYYKDGEKTFEYYTFIGDDKKVEFSTKFNFAFNTSDFNLINNQFSSNLVDISKFAPSLLSATTSEFLEGPVSIIQDITGLTIPDVMVYKNIIIFKRPFGDETEVGDTLRIESDILDCNLLVNKIVYYYQISGGTFGLTNSPPQSLAQGSRFEKYVYCYNSFNQNIVNNLLTTVSSIAVKNLNRYTDVSDLVNKLDVHSVGMGYKFTDDGQSLIVSPRFNNKTAYYNLAIEVKTITGDSKMDYAKSFLTFGFSPNYNVLDVLNRIDNVIFDGTKKFSILPEYFNLPAATFSTSTTVQVVEDNFSNKLVFGEQFKFQWESLLVWTFVDFNCFNINGDSFYNNRLLIIDKYYEATSNGYVIEFHKSIKYPDISIGVQTIDIISRNTLSQISSDLQMLNNIQRSSSEKTINSTYSFTQYENEVKFKFPTDSYLKVLVSDFDIQQKVTSIVYTDYDYQLAMNILNVEKELTYEFDSITQVTGLTFSNKVRYSLTTIPQGEFQVGDLINIELTGNTQSSRVINPQYQGLQTILDIQKQFIITSMDFGTVSNSLDTGKFTFIKRDKFLNYLPIDLYSVGGDRKPKRGVEILPEMVNLNKTIFSLNNVNVNKYKIQFVDGLFLQDIEQNFSWFLQAETSNAIVGKNDNGIVWYSGVWKCGRWFGGTWISGEWLSGDWYGGDWYSSPVKSNILSVQVSANNTDNSLSKWQDGRWFGGNWYGGTWYNGRRYGGNWFGGIWFNGVWNDGDWYGGNFQGGIWVLGKWYGGVFNCDSRLSYWLDGVFESGDFENGIWYNGQFGNDRNLLVRFGTRSINTRISIWHGGKWLGGEFHSNLNIDPNTQLPIVSDIHSLSVWKTGIWLNGGFYGGVAYNIDFRGGIWYGGILEEIQVVGVDAIYPGTTSNNKIYVNGVFKFNPGDVIYIIDDSKGGSFSAIGSNDLIRNYRINKIDEDEINERTSLYLNYNLSGLQPPVGTQSGSIDWYDLETNLRVVSHFSESIWKSGHWTNGYFENGNFESGVWYNGVFEGNWGS